VRIALISDIHGNLPALETVLEDIKKRTVDKIICLGDLIGKGPSSGEVIDICRNTCDIVIQGNWDIGIYEHFIKISQDRSSDVNDKVRWYINSMTPEQCEYMGTLPHSTEFYLSGKLVRLFHAHPRDFNRYFSDSPIEQRMELFDYSDASKDKKAADVAIYADIHGAYMQIVSDGRLLLNIGSVGNPLDIKQASYAILDGEENDGASFGVQFIRVPYDIERAIMIAKEQHVPDLDGYISELRTAKYFYRT